MSFFLPLFFSLPRRKRIEIEKKKNSSLLLHLVLRGPPEQFRGFPGEHGPRDDLYSAYEWLVVEVTAQCCSLSAPGRGDDGSSRRRRHRSCDHCRWVRRANRPASEAPMADLKRRGRSTRSQNCASTGGDRQQARPGRRREDEGAAVHFFLFERRKSDK